MPPANAPERRLAAERLSTLAAELRAEVIGQEHVLGPVTEREIQAELGLTRASKPHGSFLLLGPTGVGKTQLVKSLARWLAPASDYARFDMSEFQTRESVDVFLGQGAGDEGRFGTEMARVPLCRLILFDEFEKAYPTLLDLLLQMLDEGRLTVASGRLFDLRPLYIALTSNLGAPAAARMRHNSDAAIERTVLAAARQSLRPEFFARVDEVGVFRRLGLAVQEQVCRYHVGKKLAELQSAGVSVTVEPAVYQFLLGEGFSEAEGARPLERAIEKHINRPVVARFHACGEAAGMLRVNSSGTGLEFVEPAQSSAA